MARGRKYSLIGLLVKTYKDSKNPKKDEWVKELTDKLGLPISEPN